MLKDEFDNKKINTLNIPLTEEQLTYLVDNFFVNLGIESITEKTIPYLYDEVLQMSEYYKEIKALPLQKFANELLDKLYDFVPWQKICDEQEKENLTTNDDVDFTENDCD